MWSSVTWGTCACRIVHLGKEQGCLQSPWQCQVCSRLPMAVFHCDLSNVAKDWDVLGVKVVPKSLISFLYLGCHDLGFK